MTDTITIDLQNPKSQMHWGKYIESTVPVTGVGNEQEIGFLRNEVWDNGIDPDLAEYEKENPDEEIYEWDCHTRYLGFIQAEDGKYDFDPNEPFSVVWSDWAGGTYSILKSPYVQFCTPCSPCCPGQVSLGQPGNYLGYSSSIEDFDEGEWKEYYKTKLPEVWVWDLEYEINMVRNTIDSLSKRIQLYHEYHQAPHENAHEKERELKTYLEALSSAHSANLLNPNQRILVKQRRID